MHKARQVECIQFGDSLSDDESECKAVKDGSLCSGLRKSGNCGEHSFIEKENTKMKGPVWRGDGFQLCKLSLGCLLYAQVQIPSCLIES